MAQYASEQSLLQTSAEMRIPPRGPGPASTVICNHIGWLDILSLICSPVHPGFTPKEDLAKVPLLSTIIRCLQSLFVYRGTNKDERDTIVDQISERQRKIEDELEPYNRICLFAEATTTNGKALLPFKRGAFSSMRAVIPCFVTFSDRMVAPTYDIIDFWALIAF